MFFFFFQAEDGIRDGRVTGVQTCALPIWRTGDAGRSHPHAAAPAATTASAQGAMAALRGRGGRPTAGGATATDSAVAPGGTGERWGGEEGKYLWDGVQH